MTNLKNNLLFLFLLLSGCQTPKPFEIKSFEKEELHIVKVSSDRVKQECYFLNAEKENKWRHQYFLYILNNGNEVIAAMHPINQDDDQCRIQKTKIEKILKEDSKVTLCLRDVLIKNSEKSTPDIYIDFGSYGKHSSSYTYLTLDTICNSKQCFSISETWTDTCPGVKK